MSIAATSLERSVDNNIFGLILGFRVPIKQPMLRLSKGSQFLATQAVNIGQNTFDFVVSFFGVPGRLYRIQYSNSLSPPFDWNEFSIPALLVAPPNGVIVYTDVSPVGPTRFYRAIANP